MSPDSKLTLSEAEIRARIASVPYWFHSIEIAPGIVTPGEEDSAKKIERLDIPHDLTSKRVLDIGAYDGFFSFECERRGAEVVAIDTIPFDQSGFKVAHDLIGSNVQFRNASVYDLNPEAFGYFDVVLCLGVIYHLRHPLLGLEHIHSVCKGTLILETQICDQYFVDSKGEIANLYVVAPDINQTSIAQFYQAAELNGDPSNWWSPNLVALNGMLRSTSFKPQKIIQDGVRACVHCERVDLVITGPETEYYPGSRWKPAARSKPSAPDSMPPILSTLPSAEDQSTPPTVIDTLTADERDQQVQSYDESFRQAISEGSSIYGGSAPMPPIIQAAHERRMALLDSLPIGDISDKVCVDYGVGSWGFACIYPRLQACARAIGIDVSYEAIKASAAISEQGQFPYKNNYTYLTSRGDQLQLDDQSVDIFFTGECIEHIENTEAFLDEIHRVLKPDGRLILTTPNADAYLFRVNGEKYGVGPEHVALMSYSQLRSYLDPRFELVVAHGFNGSLHVSWDEKIADLDFAHAWASQFADRPDLGTGIVLMARRRKSYQPAHYQQHYHHHQAPEFQYTGPWEIVPLHKAMTGRLGSGGDSSRLALDFEGNGVILNFWCHAWSGEVFVAVDGVAQHVNLYSPVGGFNRIHIGALASGQHRLQIYGTQLHDVRSQANQVIFYQAVSYQRIQEPLINRSEDQKEEAMEIRPGRFGIIYTAPVLMTWSERVVLYSVLFGLRPQRCLEIGTHKGGSSLIITAALDDVDNGRLVCVDPNPLVAPEHWQQMAHRATLLPGTSPDVLPKAVEAAGGRFDFALIDGDHEYAGVVRDIEGVLPFLEDSACLLFHDAHYYQVAEAIDHMLVKYSDCLVDCGMVSAEQTRENRKERGRMVVWGGLRMLRFHKPGSV